MGKQQMLKIATIKLLRSSLRLAQLCYLFFLMPYVKCFFFLLISTLLQSCADNNNLLVGNWQYVRMERTDLQSPIDTLQVALLEAVYRGSELRFYEDETFVMSKQDSATNFAGKGTYKWDTRAKILTMEGNVRNTKADRMTVQVFELSADSLKIGSPEEMFVYSRLKE